MSKEQQSIEVEGQKRERWGLQRTMAVQFNVDQSMNQVVEDMVDLVDTTKIAKSRMEKHQIKNLLDVALDTLSVEVVKHYIYYQIGRDVSGSSWRHNDFGHELVKRLENLKNNEASTIIEQVETAFLLSETAAQKNEQSKKIQIDETWMLLVRAYLGQLNRYFYYKKEEANRDQQR